MALDDWLPNTIPFKDYGNWGDFLEAIYTVFVRDFVDSKPSFRGQRLGLKKHPIEEGKEATFWHMTSEGSVEFERTPDIPRCELISWPRPIIEHESEPEILVWKESDGRKGTRILLYLEEWRYLVVLAERGNYLLPWTAYPIPLDRDHQHDKLLRRHARATKDNS